MKHFNQNSMKILENNKKHVLKNFVHMVIGTLCKVNISNGLPETRCREGLEDMFMRTLEAKQTLRRQLQSVKIV